MSALQGIAILMVAVECATLYWSLGGWVMPLVLGLAAIGAAVIPWRWNPGWVARRVIAIAIAVVFLLWWRAGLRDAEPMYVNIAFGTNMAYAFGLHFVAIQVCQLYLRHQNGLPIHFPLLGLGAMVFAGDAFPRGAAANTGYFVLSLAFAALVCLFHARCRPRAAGGGPAPWSRHAWTGAALVLAGLLALGTAFALRWAETRVQQLLVGSAFLSPYEILGSATGSTLYGVQIVRRRDAHRIALRVVSDGEPPYLRSRVYAEYQPPRWVDARDASTVRPSRAPARAGEAAHFPVAPNTASALCSLEVLPDPAIETLLFTPLGTAWVATNARQLRVDPNGAVSVPHGAPGRPYTAHYDESGGGAALAAAALAPYLQLAEGLDPRYRALAAEIFAGRDSTREKIGAVVAWLDAHRDYGADYRAPDGEDPLTHFLFSEERLAGHCELFASAATLLLRAAGVPARYVTGVAPWERGQMGNYWVVRNRDAHAWVEAYEPGTGWITVEPTPPAGVPGAGGLEPAPWWSEAAYQANLFRVRVFAALQQGDLRGALAVLGEALLDVAGLAARGWWLWLPVAVVAALWLLRARLAAALPRLPRRAPRPAPADRPRLAALGRVDRAARRAGYRRAAFETPHQFARRIDTALPEAARWYRAYALVRYRGDEPDAVIAQAPAVAKALRGRGGRPAHKE
jgi:transglutaminase-like putative cysteine protease